MSTLAEEAPGLEESGSEVSIEMHALSLHTVLPFATKLFVVSILVVDPSGESTLAVASICWR